MVNKSSYKMVLYSFLRIATNKMRFLTPVGFSIFDEALSMPPPTKLGRQLFHPPSAVLDPSGTSYMANAPASSTGVPSSSTQVIVASPASSVAPSRTQVNVASVSSTTTSDFDRPSKYAHRWSPSNRDICGAHGPNGFRGGCDSS